MALSKLQLFQYLSKIHESVNDKSLSTTLSTVDKVPGQGLLAPGSMELCIPYCIPQNYILTYDVMC